MSLQRRVQRWEDFRSRRLSLEKHETEINTADWLPNFIAAIKSFSTLQKSTEFSLANNFWLIYGNTKVFSKPVLEETLDWSAVSNPKEAPPVLQIDWPNHHVLLSHNVWPSYATNKSQSCWRTPTGTPATSKNRWEFQFWLKLKLMHFGSH